MGFHLDQLTFLRRTHFSQLSYVFCIFGQDLEDLQANGRQNQIQHQLLLQIELFSGLYDPKTSKIALDKGSAARRLGGRKIEAKLRPKASADS